MLEKLIKTYQEASDEMLRSLKNDNLDLPERYEWFGYIRGVRDCAYDAGILSKTTIQEQLEEAIILLTNKE